MKKFLFILVLIGLGAFAYRTQIESFYYHLTTPESAKSLSLHGTYVEQLSSYDHSPPFALQFMDGTTATMLHDGKVIGNPVSYSISGDRVTVKHACGTWVLQIRKGGLYDLEHRHLFVKE